MPSHHPGHDLLLDYASGSLAEPFALVVATHSAYCPQCRQQISQMEALGGSLLESLPVESEQDEALDPGLIDRVLAQLDDAEATAGSSETPREAAQDLPPVPQPLRGYLSSADGGWRRLGGFDELRLLDKREGFTTRLMRIPAGKAMPQHSHEGQELTLVLAGGFSDADGHYLQGDVASADPTVDHQPVADPGEVCLCLAVTDAPLTLTGRFTRLLNPFIRT